MSEKVTQYVCVTIHYDRHMFSPSRIFTCTHAHEHPVHQVYTRTKWIPTAHTLIMT